MRYFFLFILVVWASLGTRVLQAQTDTTGAVVTADSSLPLLHIHAPSKAALYSAILPGLGQAYNRKYWKIPVVYAALGISGYSIAFNTRYYNELRDAYLIRTDGDSTSIDAYADILPLESQLIQYAQFYRKNLEISVIITAAIWTLNIVDALVDAHLYNFDVSDDLSMHISPAFRSTPVYIAPQTMAWQHQVGIQLKFEIR